MESLNRFRVVDSFWLKVIALVSMTVDHVAAAMNTAGMNGEWYWPMRYIGRVAFPVYCFLLVEGFFRTRNRWRYLALLLAFFALSEPIYDLILNGQLLDWSNQNVLLTLSLGLGTIWLMERTGQWLGRRDNWLSHLAAFTCLPGLALAELLNADYGYGGVLLIAAFYLFRNLPLCMCVGAFLVLYYAIGPVERYALFALIPILLYSGRRGRGLNGPVMKYAFYLYYPLHLAVILLLIHSCFPV